MIALLCSVNAEAGLLLERTNVARTTTVGSKAIVEGTLAGRDVLICVGGMGKVNAAHGATLLLARYEPDALVVFGIGGAYPSSGAGIGDVMVATEEIAGDEGVLTADGFKDTEYIGIPLLNTGSSVGFNSFPASQDLLQKTLQVLNVSRAEAVRAGPFVTVSCCTGTRARARELESRYHGICENMEGAAAAQVAAYHGVPWVGVRGISNIVEDRHTETWDIPRAAGAAQKAVLDLLLAWSA